MIRRNFLKAMAVVPVVSVASTPPAHAGCCVRDVMIHPPRDSMRNSTPPNFRCPDKVLKMSFSSDGHVVLFCENSVWMQYITKQDGVLGLAGGLGVCRLSDSPKLSDAKRYALESGCIGIYLDAD